MSKREKLTAAQIALFPEHVAKWTKIGLCTEPADRLEHEMDKINEHIAMKSFGGAK